MIDDLISRQAAIDAILQRLDALKGLRFGTSTFRDGLADGYARIMSDLQYLPSAQPEIIRCKDCKHWGIHKWLNIPWCRELHIDRGAEDFCSTPKRREDD